MTLIRKLLPQALASSLGLKPWPQLSQHQSGHAAYKAFRETDHELGPPTHSINYSLLGARLSRLSSRSKRSGLSKMVDD